MLFDDVDKYKSEAGCFKIGRAGDGMWGLWVRDYVALMGDVMSRVRMSYGRCVTGLFFGSSGRVVF